MSKAKKIIESGRQVVEGYSGEPVRKSIYSQDGKKIAGQRMGKLMLGLQDSNGFIKNVGWKEYKKSSAPHEASDYAEKEMIGALVKQLKNFGVRVDFNKFSKENNPSFEKKMDWLVSHGVKVTARGVKV